MKKRIAIVSYADAHVTQYNLKLNDSSTESTSDTGVHTKVTEMVESDEGLEVRIGPSRILLSVVEVEALLTTLLAHQRHKEGFNVEIYRKD